MRYPFHLTVILGLTAAGVALTTPGVTAQSRSGAKSEAAAAREAVRFEKTKDAAARRQLSREPSYPGRASEANRSQADRWTADRVNGENTGQIQREPRRSDTVNDSVRFERNKDAAAARQMRLDARQSDKTRKTNR
jgi:hypothetical protein